MDQFCIVGNNTKVSTTGPESGFMHRDNKPQGFFYLDHRTVDGKHGIITDSYVTPGNIHDRQPFIRRLKRQTERFRLDTVAWVLTRVISRPQSAT